MFTSAARGLTALLCFAALALAAGDGRIEYPKTKRGDQVDLLHGVEVADPYRWLEDDVRTSPDVAEWVAAQNKVTEAYLSAIPERETIRRRLTDLWNYAQYSAPMKKGGRYYFFKNDGLQNQAVLYAADSLDVEPRVLIDPNAWSLDGTIALAGLSFSDDGRYAAYAQSEAGSDWTTWRIMEIATGEILPDVLKWTKFSGAAWTKDGRGFFYTRYDEPTPGAEFQAMNFNNKLCYHKVGTPQAEDALVYHRPEHPDWLYGATVSDDGGYLIISVAVGTDARNRVLVRDLEAPYAMPIEIVDNFDHEYSFVGNDGPTLYFKTDLDAPRRRLVAIDLLDPWQDNSPLKKGATAGLSGSADGSSPRISLGNTAGQASSGTRISGRPFQRAADWREIIPQTEHLLAGASMVGRRLIANYLQDVTSRIKVFSLEGRFVRPLDLPGVGTAGGFGGDAADPETFYAFSSIATPPTIYRYDAATGESTLWRRAEVRFDPDRYEVRQVFYASKDGTRVPMFIAHRKGIKLDGSNPTLLYGYGGFNIALTPGFSVARAMWMEMGGVYALANLRGGGEYGKQWHKAGTKLQKQNVFDDFIAAAEWLIENKYTRPDKLAVEGGSNGGLLVGAVMTQRPELFGACLPAVGVMDMLRFHKFTEGRLWVDDYGSADDPDEFKALLAYSPYHNIKPGTCYPAALITTADTDDRVVPGHSFKFAAALQHAQSCGKPALIQISTRAGHGGGKPRAKQIEELADRLAFLVKNLQMTSAGE